MPLEDKQVGLLLAISSSALIGCSFIITKKGLLASTAKLAVSPPPSSSSRPTSSSSIAYSRRGSPPPQSHAPSAGDTYVYLSNWLWWCGMVTMILGEIANFAAYSFAPAVLVTPLGALSVIVGAVLASFFLDERLGTEGIIGCILCVLGSVLIILHAPAEKEINSVDEILQYAIQPPFLFYVACVTVLTLFLIYKVAPRYGRSHLLVYVSICSLVGSISVMACKGFGIALKLTFAGSNQLLDPSTWVFAVVVGVSVVTQMNYFNKALDTFSTNLVTPVYYVTFTTATISASVILFQGFNDTDTVQLVSIFCGFLTIFTGVFLLNSTRAAAEASKDLDDDPRGQFPNGMGNGNGSAYPSPNRTGGAGSSHFSPHRPHHAALNRAAAAARARNSTDPAAAPLLDDLENGFYEDVGRVSSVDGRGRKGSFSHGSGMAGLPPGMGRPVIPTAEAMLLAPFHEDEMEDGYR
ncbi:DUF803-domain-containing protein [Gonapodya prolifera JEL478]|uniref:DUF803-domain-containing protein n=1 Tax=Gonapodya prolifera (strain JEL478) TaxID=1344416 RepID=A0A139A304_GONPJ|nr:DUF803-domain-containing protein [Gonapodya prolifera JEL478]|eukprot:KXS11008.1 DUF803-domain-containing protein [Gonapodya prolifera JEL478]